MSDTRLRPATIDDARRLWLWRNEPVARTNAFSQALIPWPQHLAWFERKLADPMCRIWILECNEAAVGQIRYDANVALAEIDFLIVTELRGRGLGSELLHQSAPRACRELNVSTLVGIVRSGNEPSRRAFERAGFTDAGDEWRHEVQCRRYEWRCQERL